MRQFTPVAAFFDPAKGQAWIRLDQGIDKAAAGFKFLGGNPLATSQIAGKYGSAQAKNGVIGHGSPILTERIFSTKRFSNSLRSSSTTIKRAI